MKKKIILTTVLFSLICSIICGVFLYNKYQKLVSDERYKTYQLYLSSGGELSYEEWLDTIKGDKGNDGNGIVSIEQFILYKSFSC